MWNLIGQGIPLVVAIFTIPSLVHGLGVERFGLLAIVWMVIGYFSLFDLGIGRALTQLVAQKLGEGDERRIPSLVWTAMLLMLGLGLAGGVIVAVLAPLLVQSVFQITNDLHEEVLYSFYVLSVAIPFVVATAGLIGLLAAKQRFGLINLLRIPMGFYTYIAPIGVLFFSKNLFHIALALAAGRMAFFAIHIFLCFRVMPNLSKVNIDFSFVSPLLRFGAWMTVSNVVGPLMVYFDRFMIGAVISMTAVAYYTMPYEVVTKLWIIPTAIVAVLFPAFSSSYIVAPWQAASLFGRGTRYVILLMFPVILLIIVFAQQGLSIWLGSDFALRSVIVLQWLAVGVFINSVSQVSFALIQGVGRPDVTAKLHLMELLFYLPLLWWLLRFYGIEGAAIAWTARIFMDATLLFVMVSYVLPETKPLIWRLVACTGAHLTALALAVFAARQGFQWIYLAITLLVFMIFAWFYMLQPDERSIFKNYFKAT